MFTNDQIRIWLRCVRKWFLFPLHAGLLTIIRKRRSSQVLSISTTIFGLLGNFKYTRLKWQILPLVWVVQRQKAFSFRGGEGLRLPRIPDLLVTCPGPLPPDPRYRLALAMSPTGTFCPTHYFRPGDVPGCYISIFSVLNKTTNQPKRRAPNRTLIYNATKQISYEWQHLHNFSSVHSAGLCDSANRAF